MPEVEGVLRTYRSIQSSADREMQKLHLAANESCMSRAARALLKHSYNRRYYLGRDNTGTSLLQNFGGLLLERLPGVDELREKAWFAAHELFGAEHVDLRPLSGVHGVISTLSTLTDPGDCVLSIPPVGAGHFATAHLLERLGRRHAFLPWDRSAGKIVIDELPKVVNKTNGKLLLIDEGAPLVQQNLAEFVRAVRSVKPDAVMVYDASHTLGLIAGGVWHNPLDAGFDVLQGNTHKSFPGPQKGMIMTSSSELGEKISQSLSAGFVSSQHTSASLALYQTLLEMHRHATAYSAAMCRNATALSKALRDCGFSVLQLHGRDTESHVLLIDMESDMALQKFVHACLDSGVTVNGRNTFGCHVVRIGTQIVTRQGMGEAEMELIATILKHATEDTAEARKEVESLVSRHQSVAFSFDEQLVTQETSIVGVQNG